LFARLILARSCAILPLWACRQAWNVPVEVEVEVAWFSAIHADAKGLLHRVNLPQSAPIQYAVASGVHHRGRPGVILVVLHHLRLWHIGLFRFAGRIVQLTDLVLGKEFVLHERCFYFELTKALDLGLNTLKLFFRVVGIKFYPMRQIFVFQQPKNLKVSLGYQGCLWLLICMVVNVLMVIWKVFKRLINFVDNIFLKFQNLDWHYVFCSNVTAVELKLVILNLIAFSRGHFIPFSGGLLAESWGFVVYDGLKIFFERIKLILLVPKLKNNYEVI